MIPPGDEAQHVEWAAIDALLDGALEQPESGRRSWIERNATSPEAADRVIAILRAGDRRGILDRDIPVDLVADTPSGEIIARLAHALSGRYRIERVLGEGGMAVVVLARELKHDRAVVLKVLRPEISEWLGAARFRSEIQILARLSHPHILALIDSGEAGGLLYYVMPHVGGETLRHLLERGPLPEPDAFTLLQDLAAALAHAHHHGLVHRDLKPENILVVNHHAFLMDFGIAKLRPEHRLGDATGEGLAIGTPAYMAPEQAAGLEVDARADVYSWGLVAREILLGRRAAPVGQPRELITPLGALIEQALAESPDARPASGDELVTLLAAIEPAAAPRLKWRPAALITGLVGLTVIAWLLWGDARRSAGSGVIPSPIMVMPLANETGDSTLAMWGQMAGDWLTQGLQQTGALPVVPWPVVLQAVEASRTPERRATVAELSGATDARTVVTGAYYLTGSTVRFQVQVLRVSDGTAVAALPPVEVNRDSVRSGIRLLGERLLGALAMRADQRLSGLPGGIDQPPTYEAYRHFERGIDRFNALDYGPAIEALLEAWRSDTTFSVPLIYAAAALLNMSEYERSDSLVVALRARAVRLNPYHDLMVRYTEALLAGDARRALEMARQGTALAPGGRAHYNLARTALTVGATDEALAALRQIDPDVGMLRGWAPYWFVLSHTEHMLGAFDDEVVTSRELRRRHPDNRAAWVHEVRALAAGGRVTEVDSVIAAATSLPPDTYWSLGAMLVTTGEELEAHGHGGGDRYYRRAIEWLDRQLARDSTQRGHRYWAGSAYLDLALPDSAAPYFATLQRDFPESLTFRGLLGLTTAWRGDTAGARRLLGPAPSYRRGDHFAYLARFAGAVGDKERALELWSAAVGTGLDGLEWLHASAQHEIAGLRGDPRFQRLGILTGTGTSARR